MRNTLIAETSTRSDGLGKPLSWGNDAKVNCLDLDIACDDTMHASLHSSSNGHYFLVPPFPRASSGGCLLLSRRTIHQLPSSESTTLENQGGFSPYELSYGASALGMGLPTKNLGNPVDGTTVASHYGSDGAGDGKHSYYAHFIFTSRGPPFDL